MTPRPQPAYHNASREDTPEYRAYRERMNERIRERYTYVPLAPSGGEITGYREFRKCMCCNQRFEVKHRLRIYCDECISKNKMNGGK